MFFAYTAGVLMIGGHAAAALINALIAGLIQWWALDATRAEMWEIVSRDLRKLDALLDEGEAKHG